MDVQDAFRVLGVEPGSTGEEIRVAYRDLVAVWHPDKYAHNERLWQKAHDQLKEINAAYDLLRGYDVGTYASPSQEPNAEEPATRSQEYSEEQPEDHSYSPDEGDDEEPAAVADPVRRGAWHVRPALVAVLLVAIISFAVQRSASNRSPSSTGTSPGLRDDMLNKLNSTPNALSALGGEEVSQEGIGKLGQLKADTPIHVKPDERSRVLYQGEAGMYVVLRALKDGWETIVMKDGSDGFAEAERVERLPYDVNIRAPGGDSANQSALGDATWAVRPEEIGNHQGTPTSGGSSDPDGIAESDTDAQSSGTETEAINRIIAEGLSIATAQASANSAALATFTIGSTEQEVLDVQGVPTSVIGSPRSRTLHYGYSMVNIKAGVVTGYSNIDRNLKVIVRPGAVRGVSSFTIGSSEDEVLEVQGTPTSVIGSPRSRTLQYGYSIVNIQGGVVTGYSNIDGNLKVR